MKAEDKDFSFVRGEYKLVIPFFQRRYVWKEEQWRQLFEDLKNSFDNKKQHFLGSVVIKRLSTVDNQTIVIDGQQRLTTFSLLLKALYERMEEGKRRSFEDHLFEAYTECQSLKIQHCELDCKAYSAVILGRLDEVSDDRENRILKCFQYFQKQIKDFTAETVFEFAKYIVDQKLWVVVSLGEGEDEQKIFDSINSTGQKLTATDIIKNTLFAVVISKLGEAKASKLYQEYWKSIFEKDDKETSFWDEELETGRVKRVRSEILLHSFSIIKGIFDVEEHNLGNLSSLFKEHFDKNLKTKQDIEDFLKDLKKYATIYRDFPWVEKGKNFSYKEWEERFFIL